MVRCVPEGTPGAKRAELVTKPVMYKNGLTLTKVELHTGRSHQIRVQHASRRHPLWGDNRSGTGKPGQQIALWAARLTFDHPVTHESLTFTNMPSGSIWDTFGELGEDILL